MKMRCGKCGSKDLKKLSQRGKSFRYKDYPAVYLIHEFSCLECAQCHNLVMSSADIDRFNDALVGTIHDLVRLYVELILDREHCEQAELASYLGISPEYLSTLKAGVKIPKFQIFNFLKTLATVKEAFKVADPEFDTTSISKTA